MKEAIKDFLKSKEGIKGFPTYKSILGSLNIDTNIESIDLSGDLLSSERKKRVAITRKMFQDAVKSMDGKSENTIYIAVNLLRSVLKFVQERDGSTFWSSFRVSQKYNDILVLDAKFSKDFVTDRGNKYNKMKPEFKALHELISVMLTSTLRISDALSIKEHNLSGGRIVISNMKTTKQTISPIPDFLYDRLKKNFAKYGRPYRTNLSREYCYANLEEFLQIYKPMRAEVDGVPLYKRVRFHVFRKTAITNMLYSNVPQSVIKKASGHSESSKSFNRYVGFASGLFDKEIDNFNKKFYGSI